MAKLTPAELLDVVGSMTVIDLAEFIKGFKSEVEAKLGISLASMAMAAPAATATVAAPKEEEKSEYKVELTEAGPEKIKTIKAIRSVPIDSVVMGLSDAKAKVESVMPVVLFEAVSKDDAQKLKKALEEAGAKVKLS